jgi:threonylcarbamoyladenosine tRNA methylthiotransferase MtaB
MNERKTYHVTALGCRTNQYEAQAFRSQLEAMGYSPAEPGETADVCVVNTCTVTEAADADSRHRVRRLARDNPGSKVLVTGCLAERHPEQLQAIEGVHAVVSNAEKERLLESLGGEAALPEFKIDAFEGHTRAFVKVQDGCNSFCTYCIIPYVRGRSRSRSESEILQEVRELVAHGYKEIVLTGINIGDYDGGGNSNLAALVRAVDAIEGVDRLRISSIDPDEVDEDLLDAVVNGRSTCPSMHVVLQAGSNVILKRMNRKYTRQCFMDTVERLRKAEADFTFTTDVIVGFPGETDYDFAETLDVMREVRFAKVHMFPYSDRPRTRANLYKNKVPPALIAERKSQVLRLAEQLSYDLRQDYVGRRMLVLTENHDSGHTGNFLRVCLGGEEHSPNQLVEVDLIANTAEGLLGRPVTAAVECAG